MLLQPLHSVNYSDFHVSGDVTIQPNVAIAPGVLIQADPDSQIIIESGTCIGMGTIIHAFKGKIEIKAGVTIGTGVLIVGAVKIGANACVGSMTTVFNTSIPNADLVIAGSLLGIDISNRLEKKSEKPQVLVNSAKVEPDISQISTQTINQPLPSFENNQYQEPQAYKTTLVIESSSEVQLTESSSDRSETSIVIKESIKGTESTPQVYGQENLNRLLAKLLPHRQSLNRPLNDNKTS
ncbi:hypothetical protein Syn7502_00609 [Synechococcus sp. PCC 7502]|uniref:hypothetical protein n=1 Tax=Synechococcus sp. PCC 7502 TaxID=1173263 RepID=UPI00029F8683|nr:hypothetical protein [Synechococcus sp. PCC 7502]AFY72759.1 hypothetical protein Syn7502_00609 [Synechococcus sp. PCC 7502]